MNITTGYSRRVDGQMARKRKAKQCNTHHTALPHNRINFGIKIFCHLCLNLHPGDVSQCFGTFVSHLKLR